MLQSNASKKLKIDSKTSFNPLWIFPKGNFIFLSSRVKNWDRQFEVEKFKCVCLDQCYWYSDFNIALSDC
jgi:hypothetical protein